MNRRTVPWTPARLRTELEWWCLWQWTCMRDWLQLAADCRQWWSAACACALQLSGWSLTTPTVWWIGTSLRRTDTHRSSRLETSPTHTHSVMHCDKTGSGGLRHGRAGPQWVYWNVFCTNNLSRNIREIWPFSEKNGRVIIHFLPWNRLDPNYRHSLTADTDNPWTWKEHYWQPRIIAEHNTQT